MDDDSAEDERPEARNARDLPASRRGNSNVRQRTMSAYESLCFPEFPAEAVGAADFEMPRSVLDRDAPLSARKWCV
jgi:hypothetical protein